MDADDLYEQLLKALEHARDLYVQITDKPIQELGRLTNPTTPAAPATTQPQDKPLKRRVSFSPEFREYLKKQGRYLHVLKSLSAKDKKVMKTLRQKQGLDAALAKFGRGK